MKRAILLLFVVLISGISAQAQFKIGVSVQPGIVSSRVTSDIDTLTYERGENSFKPWLGLFVDMEFRENYVFTTGIYWAPKSLNLVMEEPGGTRELDMNVQYIQIPLLLKLLTDELALDKRVFFNVGPAFDIRIEESIGNNKEELYIDKLRFWNLNLNIGAGMEFRLGQNTVLVTGLSYYRGMINTVKPVPDLEDRLRVRQDFYALNIGIKF